MLSNDDFNIFVRTPFAVEAIKITKENIDDIGKMIGEVRVKNGEKYIAIDRRVVPNIGRAFIGWWVTAMDANIRCYVPAVFENQFLALPENKELLFSFKDQEIESPFVFNKD